MNRASPLRQRRTDTLETQNLEWRAIILLYAATLASMAVVGIVVAATFDLSAALGVARKEIGIALSLFSLPSALLAVFCGGVVDRVGAKRVIVASCGIGAAASLFAIAAGTFTALLVALAANGVAFTGVSVAAPAMIVNAATGDRRVRAMSLWSTYAPTAFALGLLIGAPFAGSGLWTPALAIHGGLMALLAALSLTLPTIAIAAPRGLTDQIRSFASVFREAGVLRLAAAVAVPSALSYGTSLIAPSYFTEVHGTSMGASATVVAVIKGVAMILCGLATGALLSRRINTLALFAGLAVLGIAAQLAIFWPGSGFSIAVVGLFAWLIAFGGMSAAAMALLSGVVPRQTQSGAASGLIGQAISILSFLAPSVYFGMTHWIGFVLLAGIGLALSTLALPVARSVRTQPAE